MAKSIKMVGNPREVFADYKLSHVPTMWVSEPAIPIPLVPISFPCTCTIPSFHSFSQFHCVSIPSHPVSIPSHHVSIPSHHVSIPSHHVFIPFYHVPIPFCHVPIPFYHVSIPFQPYPRGSRQRSWMGRSLCTSRTGKGEGQWVLPLQEGTVPSPPLPAGLTEREYFTSV